MDVHGKMPICWFYFGFHTIEESRESSATINLPAYLILTYFRTSRTECECTDYGSKVDFEDLTPRSIGELGWPISSGGVG